MASITTRAGKGSRLTHNEVDANFNNLNTDKLEKTGGTSNFALGSVTAPSISFSGDANTGIYSSGDDTVNITTNGTERMRINSTGAVGIGATPASGNTLQVSKSITGAISPYAVYSNGTIQSDVTGAARLYGSFAQTENSNFSITTIRHYSAEQGTFSNTSAGGAVTNQHGFHADSSLVSATNNYGFFSNIAAATGRWNFYANGTADNYFGGNVYIGAAKTIIFDGTTADANKVTLSGGDPTATRTITLPDATGTVALIGTDPTNVPAYADLGTAAYIDTAALVDTAAPSIINSSTSTVAANATWLIVNFAGTCTLTLQAAASYPGKCITVKTVTANTVVSAASDVVPLAGGSAGTAILAATAGKWARLVSDGSNWVIMEGN